MCSAHCPAWRTIASFPRWYAASSGARVLFFWFSCRHGTWAALRERELGLGEGLNVFDCGVRSNFAEEETGRSDIDQGQLGDNVVDDFDAGERQRALFQDFALVIAGGVLHGDENALGAGDQVHGTAHAFQHFAGDGPVGEIALCVDLQRAKDGEVHVAAANHSKGIGRRKITGAGKLGDGFLPCIDEIGIDFGFERIGTNAKHAVFRLQHHFNAFGNIIGDERGHADAEIDVEAIAQFLRDAAGNAFAFLFVSEHWSAFAHRSALDFFLVVGALEDGVDEDAGGVDLVGRQLAEFDELLDFSDYVIGGRGHHGIEVARGLAIDEIAPAIAFPGFDEREVPTQPALQNVVAAVELAGFFSFGNQGAVAGRCVEGGDTSATGANALGESALRIQLDLHFAAEHALLEKFVFPDVGGNHFFDLAILQEQAEAGAVGAGVVAGNGQILGAFAAYCVDQMLRDPAEAEAADEDGGAVSKFGNGGVGRSNAFVHGDCGNP